MLATHLAAAGMEPVLADLTFDSYPAALECGARAAAFSLYIDDFAEGARLAGHRQGGGPAPGGRRPARHLARPGRGHGGGCFRGGRGG